MAKVLQAITQVKKTTPLFGFDTILDTDFGVIKLINDRYMDRSVFDTEKFSMNTRGIIKTLYLRKDPNPLYEFANPGVDHDLLDEYYKEFMDTQIDNVFERCIGTEIQNVIKLFLDVGDIKITVLCKNEKQKEFAREINFLSKCRVILPKDIKDNASETYDEFYFKLIDDSEFMIDKIIRRSLYYSSARLNFDDEGKFKESETIIKAIRRNVVYKFDLYKTSILE